MDGEVDQGPWLQERVGGGVGAMAVPNKGEGGLGWLGRGQGRVGLAVGGGCKGFGSGQVGGRGTGPRDGANSAMFTVPCDALNTA